jgi:hypothetical protein
VADGEVPRLLIEIQDGEGGPHPLPGRITNALVSDTDIGGDDRISHSFAHGFSRHLGSIIGAEGLAASQNAERLLDRELARHVAGGMTSHPVRDEDEAQFGVRIDRVLVSAPTLTDVRDDANGEPRGHQTLAIECVPTDLAVGILFRADAPGCLPGPPERVRAAAPR